MATATLIVFGFLLGVVIAAVAVLMYLLLRQLSDTAGKVDTAVKALEYAAQVFGQSANVSEGLIALVAVQRRSISALESMTASIKTFTGIVLREGPPPEAPPDSSYQWRPGGPPPPPNPAYEENASSEDAGYMEQDDEALAEIERQNELREQGIETDPLRIHLPDEKQINHDSV